MSGVNTRYRQGRGGEGNRDREGQAGGLRGKGRTGRGMVKKGGPER